MKRFNYYLKLLIQAATVVVFVLQMSYAIQKCLDKPTLSSFSTRSLQSLDKPLHITVCKTSQFDYARALGMGYSLQTHFFSGQLSMEPLLLSWTGVRGNLTFNETLHYLYRTDNDKVEFQNPEGNISTKFFLANGFCKKIELNSNQLQDFIIINIKDSKNPQSYRITVSDPDTANSFQLSHMSGDEILHDTKQGHRYVDYKIRIREARDETDRDACTQYPNQHHQSLADCVDEYVVAKTKLMFGFSLPFISGATLNVTPIARLDRHEATINWIQSIASNSFGGIMYQPSTCLPPCTYLSTKSEYILDASYDKHSIYLFFDATVEVQTTVLAYDFDSLLVEVGSSLGLWLGLSVVAVFDLLLAILEISWRKIQIVLC